MINLEHFHHLLTKYLLIVMPTSNGQEHLEKTRLFVWQAAFYWGVFDSTQGMLDDILSWSASQGYKVS
jgi:hypothetical protein